MQKTRTKNWGPKAVKGTKVGHVNDINDAV